MVAPRWNAVKPSMPITTPPVTHLHDSHLTWKEELGSYSLDSTSPTKLRKRLVGTVAVGVGAIGLGVLVLRNEDATRPRAVGSTGVVTGLEDATGPTTIGSETSISSMTPIT
ncbi:hypothetical protein VNO77_25231 [Canavalia gladiata]|uniref:Uncharacterized protein n=1 Tax=Canavalia gladiata TaxID=3824 RepID=A0AAN9QDC5_CANGL